MPTPGNSRSKNSADTLPGASTPNQATSSATRTKQEAQGLIEQSLVRRGLSSQKPLADDQIFDDSGTSRAVNGAEASKLISGNFSTRSHTLSSAECEEYNADTGLLGLMGTQGQVLSGSSDAAKSQSSASLEETKIVKEEGEYETYSDSEEMESDENASASFTGTSTTARNPEFVVINGLRCYAPDIFCDIVLEGSSNDCNANATKKEDKMEPAQRGRSPTRSSKSKVGRPRKMPGCDARKDIVKVPLEPVVKVKRRYEPSPSTSRHSSPIPARSRRCSCSRSKKERQASQKRSRSLSSRGGNNSCSYGDSRSGSSSSKYRLAASQKKTGKRSKSGDGHDNLEIDSQDFLQADSLSQQLSRATLDTDSSVTRQESEAQNLAGEERDLETRDKKKNKKHSPHMNESNHSPRGPYKMVKKNSNCKCRHHSPNEFALCLVM